MERKVYGIYGMVEHSVLIPFSGNNIRVDFTGGMITGGGVTPAKFKTSNILMQRAIETSDKFKSGHIKLLVGTPGDFSTKVVKAETPDAPSPEEDENPNQESVATYEEVTNSQQAKAILMEKYGVSMAELQNAPAVRAKAEELKINFPNW